MTPAGIEPEIFRFVTQHLPLCYRSPPIHVSYWRQNVQNKRRKIVKYFKFNYSRKLYRLDHGPKTNNSVIDSLQVQFFSSAKPSRSLWDPRGGLSPSVKQPVSEAGHSHPRSIKAKNEWSFVHAPPPHYFM